MLYTGKTKGNFYGAAWAAPVFKRIADKIYASHPEWNRPLSSAGKTPPDNPRLASGLAGQKGMPIDYMPMRTRPVEDGWIHVDLDKSSGEQSISGLAIEQGIVPDVEGMGIKDAVYLLENEGYKVVFHGSGRVSSQTPAAGDPLEKGKQITLTLK